MCARISWTHKVHIKLSLP